MTALSASIRATTGSRMAPRTAVRLAWAGWFLGFGMLSALWPRDAGFDVMHYHLHNGWSALHRRFGHDLAPAEMHSFLNPAYNMAVWWLIERLPGPAVAFLIGLVQAAILPMLYGLSRRFARSLDWEMGARLALFLALLGFFCAPAWTGFASLRNDHIGALAFLAGLYLILPPVKGARVPALALVLGAACVGFAAGLKLTNIIYIPAFAAFALILTETWRERAQRAAICTIAGAAAFAAAAGPWMWVLWQEFANPVFPNFAGAFPGLEAPAEASRDVRYLPANPVEAITLPLRASFEGRFINELAAVDLRLALAYLSALVVTGLALTRRSIPRPALALAISLLTLLAVWIGLFSIMRYAMAVWILAPLMAWTALRAANVKWPTARKGEVLALGAGLVLMATTSPENVRRVGWDTAFDPYVSVQRPVDLSYDDALILVAAEFPAAFTATAFPEARLTHIDAQEWSAPFLAPYRKRIEAAVSAHTGPIYLIHCWPKRIDLANGETLTDAYTPAMALEEDGARYGLSLSDDGCRELPTSFSTENVTWQICPLVKG